MGLLGRIFTRRAAEAVETRAASDYLPGSFSMFGAGGYNDTGVSISESNALIATTVWSCVSLISQTIATLPIHVIDTEGVKQRGHPIAKLLAVQPNLYMNAAVFREAMLGQALLWGGSWAAIDKDETGRPIALYPLASGRTKPIRQGGELVYETKIGSDTHFLTADRVVSLLGWTQDGITPLSPVQHAKQAIGLSVAAERYAGKAFGTAGNLGGILQMPAMSKDAMKAFVESWRANYSGLDAAFKIAALPDPMKFVPTTMTPEQAQLVTSRQATVVDLCRIWKVPPSMLGVLEKSSFASLEQQNTSYYQQCILPWLVKLEQEFMAKLLLESEKDTLEIRFNADALLRASTQERYAAYNTGRQAGFLSVNDIRRRESLPPIEGGDTYLSPLNMTPANQQTPGTTPPPGGGTDPTKQEASRSLIIDAARRLLVKESRALARLLKKHPAGSDEFRAAAASFYTKHVDLIARVMASPIRAAGLTTTAADYATQHVAESIRQLTDITTDDLEDWPEFRAVEIADNLINGDEDDDQLAAA